MSSLSSMKFSFSDTNFIAFFIIYRADCPPNALFEICIKHLIVVTAIDDSVIHFHNQPVIVFNASKRKFRKFLQIFDFYDEFAVILVISKIVVTNRTKGKFYAYARPVF